MPWPQQDSYPHILVAECVHESVTLLKCLQGMAKRVPVGQFQEQAMGQQGVKAITLAVGDAVVAMHARIYPGELRCHWAIMATSSNPRSTRIPSQVIPPQPVTYPVCCAQTVVLPVQAMILYEDCSS